jgi:predicted DNA-binding transcriptional regulator AlpA/DNA-binding transcriptional ArsR family regulator
VTPSRPAWTLTEAVQRTGASRSTLRRYLDAGKFPNAYKDTSKAWRFPLEDLLAAGLSLSEPTSERALSTPTEQGQSTPTEQAKTISAEQVSKLEQALRDERIRADNAERLAASYLDNVQDLRRALRMIEAGTGKNEQATEHALSTSTEQAMTAPGLLTDSAVSKPEQAAMDTTKGRPNSAPLWRRLLARR